MKAVKNFFFGVFVIGAIAFMIAMFNAGATLPGMK
jgi:hypothetical protein